MTYEEHVQLRNDLYQTSLKLFHSDNDWFSEYIPSVSKWRVKVMLREKLRSLSEEENANSPVQHERGLVNNHPTSSLLSEDNSINPNQSEETPHSPHQRHSTLDMNDQATHKDEISIKLPSSPSQVSGSSYNFYIPNKLWGAHEKSDSTANYHANACKINVDNNKVHVDNNNSEISEHVHGLEDEGNLRIDFEDCVSAGSGSGERGDEEYRVYGILTGRDGGEFRRGLGSASSYGLTLWEYLPLVAILSGCTGIFIIFRLSSAMYRFSVLSCIISHMVTFMLIGIPLSQLEFSMRKRGQRYGLLEAMQYFNPKYVGITVLSLITVVVIFLYSLQIISTLSVILYNIPKRLWRVTLDDTLICSRINRSILPPSGELIDFIKSGNLTTERLNYAYSLCSLSSMCNVVIPFFQDPVEVMDVVKSYSDVAPKKFHDPRFLATSDPGNLLQANLTSNATDQGTSPNIPTWCIPSPSKKLRNLLVLQQSGYQETIYFSLSNALNNVERLIKTQIFPMKKPLNWFNPNLCAQIFGLSVAFVFIIFSINGGGKLFRIASFLSFLSLITLFLTASIQVVASDIHLNIFISIVVTQDGIESLLSPAIWYCSINNTLLFFGISFLITMFPLSELTADDPPPTDSGSFSPSQGGLCDRIGRSGSGQLPDTSKSPNLSLYEIGKKHEEKVSMSMMKEPRIGEITLRKHVSRMYKSVYNQEMESKESRYKDSRSQAARDSALRDHSGCTPQLRRHPSLEACQSVHEEHKSFPSLMSAANSALFFLACVIISSMVVLISNAALISLSESPNTPLLLPYNEKFYNETNTSLLSEKVIEMNKDSREERILNFNVNNSKFLEYLKSYETRYLTVPNLFQRNTKVLQSIIKPESAHLREVYHFFNGESPSTEEISFLNTHMLNWFKWNFLQIKSQSLLLGEYMIIYLLIIAIEVSKRIPSGVAIFFVLVVFTFAISSACMCTSIISKHIFVIVNNWILPIISSRRKTWSQGPEWSRPSEDNKNIRRLKKSVDIRPMRDWNLREKFKKLERLERRRGQLSSRQEKEGVMQRVRGRLPVIYKIKCFFKLIFCILSSFFLLLKIEILKFFGISYWNKQERRTERMIFLVQLAFVSFLLVLVVLINVASVFIPRFPLDKVDVGSSVLQEKLQVSDTAFLNFSERNELSKYHNGDIYVAKTFTIVFGSLLDIQVISNSVNFMLALTAGIETVILTWYMYRGVQEQIVGRSALRLQAIGYIVSTVLLSIGFLLGTRLIFLVFVGLSLLVYLVFFAVARYFAKKSFSRKHEQVIKRQKYSPTWWLYVSNIDILRRRLNSQELEDADSLTYCSERPTKQMGLSSNSGKEDHHFRDSIRRRDFSKNEELIQSIANFNLYCSVRSRQPLFISFWFILAKYFSPILIFSTVPLSIANAISMLFLRLDSLDGIVSEIFLLNYISSMKVNTINVLNRVSIFQPIQVVVVGLLSVFGILVTLLITMYIKYKQERLRRLPDKSTAAASITPPSEENFGECQEINLNNILDDVYESLKVPKCAELYSNKVERLGKMPQKLIISLAMLENRQSVGGEV
ncbi:transmembrane domain-containing protein [Cryptosporidium canis]|nr:transmembrane domain-containing protein [Cryptosporidium canis]